MVYAAVKIKTSEDVGASAGFQAAKLHLTLKGGGRSRSDRWGSVRSIAQLTLTGALHAPASPFQGEAKIEA
jgi:hypothetical protein